MWQTVGYGLKKTVAVSFEHQSQLLKHTLSSSNTLLWGSFGKGSLLHHGRRDGERQYKNHPYGKIESGCGHMTITVGIIMYSS